MIDERTRLLRKRTTAWAFLTLGLSMSIVANVMHAEPSLIGRVIAAWPPVALLGTIELISRVPVHSRRMAALRVAAASLVAGIAAWVSYWHMAGVAQGHGESVDSAHLFPLTVDGFVVVSSICLFEIAGKLRAHSVDQAHVVDPTQSTQSTRPDPTESTPVDQVDSTESTESTESGRPDSRAEALAGQSTESGESTEASRVIQLRRPVAVSSRVTEPKSTGSKAKKVQEYAARIKKAAEDGTIDWPLNKTRIMEALEIGKGYTDAACRQIKEEEWAPKRQQEQGSRARAE